MSHARHRPHHTSLTVLVIAAVLSATFMFALAAVVSPSDALGASSTKVALCPANLRNAPSLASGVRKVSAVGTKMTVTGSVAGGSYRVSCAGRTVSSNTWYRVSAVNGKAVKSLFGRTYVYVAKGLVGMAPVTRLPIAGQICEQQPGRRLRRRRRSRQGPRSSWSAKVTGASWSRTCAGVATSGNVWYRISPRLRRDRQVPLRRDLRVRSARRVQDGGGRRRSPRLLHRRRRRRPRRPAAR